MPDEPVLFHEEQGFRKFPAMLLLAAPPVALIVITLRQVVWGHPWGSVPSSNGDLIFLCILVLAVYIRLNTVRLVTDLRAKEVSIRLKGLWIKRTIALGKVKRAKAVEYDAVRDFRGYGIRSGRRGKGYIAHGKSGVELEMADGRKVVIGSQDSNRLAAQITAALGGL